LVGSMPTARKMFLSNMYTRSETIMMSSPSTRRQTLVPQVPGRFLPSRRGRGGLAGGRFWAALTVAFEFLFFHYLGGHSWAALLANYNVRQGRVWVFVVLWLAVAPFLFFRYRVRADSVAAASPPVAGK